MSFWNIVAALFFIMDPMGNIAPILALTDDLSLPRQRKVILREMGFALIAMFIFYLVGEYLFSLLNLSDISVNLAAGMILFITAVKIIFPNMNNPRDNLPKGKPYVTPIAIPLIAGPSLLATIMVYAHLVPTQSMMILALSVAWILATVILLFSRFLHRTLGDKGLIALERLMGMILILLALQRFLEGIQLFVFENLK